MKKIAFSAIALAVLATSAVAADANNRCKTYTSADEGTTVVVCKHHQKEHKAGTSLQSYDRGSAVFICNGKEDLNKCEKYYNEDNSRD